MTSKHVKDKLMDRLTFFNGYVGAVHEIPALNNADVIAVKRGTIQEFEIKCSKADLVGEMRCARIAAGLDDVRNYTRKEVQLALETDDIERSEDQIKMIYERGHTLSRTKIEKHTMYLQKPNERPTKPAWAHKDFIPNTFYWCIPYELMDICKELNKGLPYGIYVHDMPQTNKYYMKFIISPARSLRPSNDWAVLYGHLFNRSTTLLQDARHEIKRLNDHIAKSEAAPM